jgi:hemerythrin
VLSEAENCVLENMLRKERQSHEMFSGILREMNKVIQNQEDEVKETLNVEVPSWINS